MQGENQPGLVVVPGTERYERAGRKEDSICKLYARCKDLVRQVVVFKDRRCSPLTYHDYKLQDSHYDVWNSTFGLY